MNFFIYYYFHVDFCVERINQLVMNILYIQSSHTSPEVRLNSAEKILNLKGRSSPENSLDFYQKIYDSVDQYFISEKNLTLNVMFEYFNTSSSKCLFVLFRKLKNYLDIGNDITINWFYEEYDEDMLETGEDFATIIDVDLNLIEVPDGQDIDDYGTMTGR